MTESIDTTARAAPTLRMPAVVAGYRSGFAPKLLGVLVAVAGAGYLVHSFAALLFTGYGVSVGAFTFVGEFLLMLWLLIKGRTISAIG
jgi:hypothetical protein